MKWTQAHIDNLKESGKIRDYKVSGSKKDESVRKVAKKSKYGNKKTVVEIDGVLVRMDSKKEACRYYDLKFLKKIGDISELRLQVPYQLSVCKYVSDFVYKDKTGIEIVEDVKSKATRKIGIYRIKKKLMLSELGIEIKEV